MIKTLIIDNNNIKESNIKNIDNDNIYKKLGYKNNKNFSLIKSYKNNNDEYFNIYGKNTGNDNMLNTYSIFVNNDIHVYGKAIVLKYYDDKYLSISQEEFNLFFDNKTPKESDLNQDTSTNTITNTNTNTSTNNTDDELSDDVYCYSSDED